MLFYSLPFILRGGRIFAYMFGFEINGQSVIQGASLGAKKLSSFDIILMRKDPPFDMEYIYATYALELAEKKECAYRQ